MDDETYEKEIQELKFDPVQKKLYHQTRNPPPIKEVKGLAERLISLE